MCDLIESKKPAGLLAFLDEECLLGKGTDLTFLEKCDHNLKAHAHFERAKEKGKPDDSFIVKHYVRRRDCEGQGRGRGGGRARNGSL